MSSPAARTAATPCPSPTDSGAVQELNRARFSERFDLADYRYHNLVDSLGDVLLEASQNHTTYTLQGKGEYAASPDTAVFAALAWNQRDFQNGGAQGVNSSGYEVTAGASFDFTHLVRGELQVGYLEQDFTAAPAAVPPIPSQAVAGPAYHGRIEWFPTGLTTVTLSGDRAIEDFTVPGASGTLGTGGALQIDHELLRNVILSARTGYNAYKYIGADRTDRAWASGANADYQLNRHVGLALSYRRLDQTSTVSSLNFKDNRIGLALTLRD